MRLWHKSFCNFSTLILQIAIFHVFLRNKESDENIAWVFFFKKESTFKYGAKPDCLKIKKQGDGWVLDID